MRLVVVAKFITLLLLCTPSEARKSWHNCHIKNPREHSGQLISQSKTKFKYWNARRSANVRLAGDRLNGVVLAPGAQLSYNQIVGKRSQRAGFRPAPVIASRKFVDGLGGGVCQTSSTLHAAAIKAGLKIVERWPHTWTSTYIAPGFDATVHYPTKDLIMKNPYEFPVQIVVDSGEDHITVQLYGAEVLQGWVDIATRPFRMRAYKTIVKTDARLAQGQSLIALPGLAGMHVKRTMTRVSVDGQRVTRKLPTDVYYTRDEVKHVGTTLDTAGL